VTKTAPDRPIDGLEVPYTITITNRGVSPAPDVALTDTLPPTFTLVAIDPSQGTCDLDGATCRLGTLAPGATATIGLLAAPPFPDFAGDTDFTNVAEATSGGRELNPADNRAAVTRRSLPVVDVHVDPDMTSPVLAGGEVTLTFRFANRGPQTAEVQGKGFIDFGSALNLLNPRIASIDGPGECVFDGPDGVFCGFPSLEAGGERIVTVTGTIPATAAGRAISLGQSAHASQYESFLTEIDNNALRAFIVQGVNVAVDKTRLGDGAPVPAGGEATFRLTARNAGGLTDPHLPPEFLNQPATGVTVRDELPAGLTMVGAPPGCTAAGQVVTCDAATLALGEQRSFDLRVRAGTQAAGRPVRNVATVTAAEPDWRPEDDHDTAELELSPLPSSQAAASPPPQAAAPPPPVDVTADCRSQRRLTIRLRERRARLVRSAQVRVNGRRVAVVRRRGDHRLVAVVDLRALPRGTYRVEITARLRDGRRARWVRSYRTCSGQLPSSNRLDRPGAL
jgi:uncharacterized protein DUF11